MCVVVKKVWYLSYTSVELLELPSNVTCMRFALVTPIYKGEALSRLEYNPNGTVERAAAFVARSRSRAARGAKQHAQPDARFKRDFLDRSFGHSCKVCDRLWFNNNLTRIGNIQNDTHRTKALSVLCNEFDASYDGKSKTDYNDYVVCASCKDSLIAGRVPAMSVSYGYRYPPRPDHLPELNTVEERLIAPRLPFLSIRRLTHGNGQYGIKGQVVNVPIEVPTLVQCLPRNVSDDAAIDVHIKRILVSKASYKRGLVKRSNIHAWLKHLEQTPLYRYVNVQIDWSRLDQFDGDDAECNDDEIEALPEITDLDDPMQAVIAPNAVSQTIVYDDVGVRSEEGVRKLVDNTYSLDVARRRQSGSSTQTTRPSGSTRSLPTNSKSSEKSCACVLATRSSAARLNT
ncbi:hypothetical protein HPB49_014416 [Dermacentor silvarum]|uniref:Uncharacterized protein n=1 Tax=Dermacentor silvarum TaxID=543639 RepID=A0ACB8D663_DERSI|nr:hypothetical protein HPB49_014416 [Dermacentor silvarum]